jgi:hypothetical protein
MHLVHDYALVDRKILIHGRRIKLNNNSIRFYEVSQRIKPEKARGYKPFVGYTFKQVQCITFFSKICLGFWKNKLIQTEFTIWMNEPIELCTLHTVLLLARALNIYKVLHQGKGVPMLHSVQVGRQHKHSRNHPLLFNIMTVFSAGHFSCVFPEDVCPFPQASPRVASD